MATLQVDVVSAEGSIFSGQAAFVALPGESGELGILPRHTPLITRIKPGAVRIKRAGAGKDLVADAGNVDHRAVGAGFGEGSGEPSNHFCATPNRLG